MTERIQLHHDPDLKEDESYWIPIGDLMAGLMFLFILALTAYMLTISNVIEDITQSNNVRSQILNEIKEEMEREGYSQLVIIENLGVLRLEQGILFNPGEADLLESGKEILGVLGKVMYRVLSKEKYAGEVNTIFIEGHTDGDPIIYSTSFESNWDLSAYRAINTWRYLRSQETRLERFLNDIGEPLFSISGYADSRPVASNETEEGKRANRRIDFRINMKPPSSPSEAGLMEEFTEITM